MSPARADGEERVRGFPRVSGDEPNVATWMSGTLTFSPRERG